MNGPAAASEELVFKSCPDVTRSKVRWDIENFSLICPKDVNSYDGLCPKDVNSYDGLCPRSFTSPEQVTKIEFSPPRRGEETKTETKIKWALGLAISPSTTQQEHDHKSCLIEVRFEPFKLPTELWSFEFKVSVIGQGNAVVLTRSATSLLKGIGQGMNRYEGIHAPTLSPIDSSELWANEQTHIVNDTLQLQVELAFCPLPQTKQLSVQSCHTRASHLDDLTAGMAQLWKSGKGSDLTISCGDRVFKVHSVFVKCRSPVLERMLESGMTESANSSIKIEDVDPTDFEALLDYLYTGKLPEAGKGASATASPFIGLMQVADKYEVLKLRDYCFQKMIEHISMDNAGEIAVFAHLHSAPAHVKNTAVNFCLRNWKTLSQDVNFNAWTLQNPAAFLPGRGTQ